MHNGEITGFRQIKRALQMSLPEELFLYPSGYTDAEWAFMLFLSKLKDPHARKFTHTELKNAMMETIATLNTMLKEAGIVSSPVSDIPSKLTCRLVPVCSTLWSVMATL
jgi:glutamine amidotransferase